MAVEQARKHATGTGPAPDSRFAGNGGLRGGVRRRPMEIEHEPPRVGKIYYHATNHNTGLCTECTANRFFEQCIQGLGRISVRHIHPDHHRRDRYRGHHNQHQCQQKHDDMCTHPCNGIGRKYTLGWNLGFNIRSRRRAHLVRHPHLEVGFQECYLLARAARANDTRTNTRPCRTNVYRVNGLDRETRLDGLARSLVGIRMIIASSATYTRPTACIHIATRIGCANSTASPSVWYSTAVPNQPIPSAIPAVLTTSANGTASHMGEMQRHRGAVGSSGMADSMSAIPVDPR